MLILTPSASNFPIPPYCPFCNSKRKPNKYGKRKRHAIEKGKKNWYYAQRMRCTASGCRCMFTILRPNMLPYKHYAAGEIEQVIQKQENPAASSPECGAEESTLRKWRLEIPQKLSEIAAYLETLLNVSKIYLLPPLQRVYNALDSLTFSLIQNRLAWAFFLRRFNPVRL